MNNPQFTLITVDYPPARGGVARYLSELVRVSRGAMTVIDANKFFRKTWPRWWPILDVCFEEGRKGRSIFVSHVFPIGTAAWIAKMTGGPSYAILFHGLDIRLVRGWWKRWLLRRICSRASALFANSEATATDLKRLVPNETVTLLAPGVVTDGYPSREEARRTLNLDPDAKIVLSVCRLIPRKGIDISLQVMSRVQSKKPVAYVVLGDGPDRDRLETIAAEHHCEVRWVRDADDDEKRRWLAAADVFLLPVRDEGNDVEGFGIVYLEAAAAGIPSIAGRSGGAIEAVRHERTGIVVHPYHVDEIERAVTMLLGDEDLRTKLGAEGKKRVLEDFRWEERWDKVQKAVEPRR